MAQPEDVGPEVLHDGAAPVLAAMTFIDGREHRHHVADGADFTGTGDATVQCSSGAGMGFTGGAERQGGGCDGVDGPGEEGSAFDIGAPQLPQRLHWIAFNGKPDIGRIGIAGRC
ncbi:hypothetical protein ACFQ61_17750 [Streptomyces sp. NPDC056500]|uniref:hypothetical protein n=1 Tax=Streptomyces sp. NPDC056500 TaxID=3345840 RepID=UPI0036C480B5